VAHLLKWQFQPAHRSSSRRGSIAEQRVRILRRLRLSPSLKPCPMDCSSVLESFFAVPRARPIRRSPSAWQTGIARTLVPRWFELFGIQPHRQRCQDRHTGHDPRNDRSRSPE
jgi:hypothetical protein